MPEATQVTILQALRDVLEELDEAATLLRDVVDTLGYDSEDMTTLAAIATDNTHPVWVWHPHDRQDDAASDQAAQLRGLLREAVYRSGGADVLNHAVWIAEEATDPAIAAAARALHDAQIAYLDRDTA
jgi:hypothetical protein